MAGDAPALAGYLRRIGFEATPRVDLATLRGVHRAHLLAIPYENLDVQLGVPVVMDLDGIYHKIVETGRGGWCYEMNGLLGWALEQIGFPVTPMAGATLRDQRGLASVGNHLALRVMLDGPYLADVGFGDGLLEPVPLQAGSIRQNGLDFRLERLADGWWRFHNQPHGGARNFDFEETAAAPAVLARQCEYLQTSPESPFTRVAVVQRHRPGGLAMLRGRVFCTITASGVARREVASQRDYAALLKDVFGLPNVPADRLWTRVEAQHADYLAGLESSQPGLAKDA